MRRRPRWGDLYLANKVMLDKLDLPVGNPFQPAGNLRRKTAPPPSAFSDLSSPFWARARSRAMASPRPVPPLERLLAVSTRQTRSKMCLRSSEEMPGPRALDDRFGEAVLHAALYPDLASEGVCLSASSRRTERICAARSESPRPPACPELEPRVPPRRP